MSKRLVLLFCVLFALAFAVPAFAAVQNVKVSGDILARFIGRNNFDLVKDNLAGDGDVGNPDSVLNTAVRVRIDADLTDNVSTVVRLINENNWGRGSNSSFMHDGDSGWSWYGNDATNSSVQVDLAYVQLKEFLCSPLTLTIGRQELHFGNDMIIGDGVGLPAEMSVSGHTGTNQSANYGESTGLGGINGDLSLRKSFDAIRATLNFDPLVLDVVYSKIKSGEIIRANGSPAGNQDDIDLYGVNAGYKFSDKWHTMAEGYFWAKINQTPQKILGINNKDQVYTFGGRVSTNPSRKLNLQQEFAWQSGKKANVFIGGNAKSRDAFATQSIAMVTPGWKYEPTMGLIYSFFSGEADLSSTKDFHAWDPMFENQTAGNIINALFAQSNAHNIDLMAKITPMQDITLRADFVYVLLARRFPSNFSGGPAEQFGNEYNTDNTSYAFVAKKKVLGQELDLTLTYDYTEDVQFGLLAGWFMPGSALNKIQEDGERVGASELIASCKVSF